MDKLATLYIMTPLAMLLLGLAPASAQAPSPTENCPQWCEVDPAIWDTGTLPPVLLFMDWVDSTNGIGTDECYTCIPCRGKLAIEWDDLGSGYCGAYSTDGGQTIWPLPSVLSYREAKLESYCADPEPAEVWMGVGACNGSYGLYEKTARLYCYCNEQ
jgi:hypothetical protein